LTNENASPACHDFAISEHKQRVNVKKEIQIFIFTFISVWHCAYENERSDPKLGPVQPASQCPASGCALSISSLTFESESKPAKKANGKVSPARKSTANIFYR
jgi:hypothetical protein